MSDRKSLWNVIIPNLTKADQLSLSLVNKDNRRKVLCYWFDLVTMQVDNIERVINHSIDVKH